VLQDHPRVLQHLTKAVAIARRPVEEWQQPLRSCEAALPAAGSESLAWSLMPNLPRLGDAFEASQAQLRCMIAMLAVERYRLEKRRVPATLDELVPRFLAAVSLDPFDGKPLHYCVTDEGVIVYSVGPDGQDNGGTLDPGEPRRPGADLGYRLWRPDRRRQPPLPEAPGEPAP
jgi:hypothetical protein